MIAETVLVTPIDEAKKFIINCFEAVGTCHEHAEIIADNLIEADYRGHYSHGLNRLRSNHYGIAGMYSLQAIKEGCIGISATNTSPVMVPTRAKKAALGTNPISIGAPRQNGDSPVLDMATTTVAIGKLELSRRKGQPLPQGWAVNDDGIVETDPEIALKAQKLLPLGGDELSGGYKGYGLSFIVELLSGILSGANYGPNVPIWNGGDGLVANLGHVFIAINPEVFAPGFDARLSDLMDYIRQMESRDPAKPILIPGDPEKNHMEYVKTQGGFCYVKNQHDTNNMLVEKLKVLPMKSVEKEKLN